MGLSAFPIRQPCSIFQGFDLPAWKTGSGTWKLGDGGEIRLTFTFIKDWNQNELPYGTALGTSQGWSALTLYYYLGDPDERRRVEFEKN